MLSRRNLIISGTVLLVSGIMSPVFLGTGCNDGGYNKGPHNYVWDNELKDWYYKTVKFHHFKVGEIDRVYFEILSFDGKTHPFFCETNTGESIKDQVDRVLGRMDIEEFARIDIVTFDCGNKNGVFLMSSEYSGESAMEVKVIPIEEVGK